MVISRSTRSMFCISSSFEKRAGTKSKSGSMCTGLTGEIGSSFPMALPRSCRDTSEVLSFKITVLCIFRSQNQNNKFSFIQDNGEDWGNVVCQASLGWIWGFFFLKHQPSSSCAEGKCSRGSAWYSIREMKRVETYCCLICVYHIKKIQIDSTVFWMKTEIIQFKTHCRSVLMRAALHFTPLLNAQYFYWLINEWKYLF